MPEEIPCISLHPVKSPVVCANSAFLPLTDLFTHHPPGLYTVLLASVWLATDIFAIALASSALALCIHGET